jgi:Undecaprenyl-phosphate galactose phosphotransferase WbaP
MGGLFFHLLPLGVFGLVLAVPVVRSGIKWVLRHANLWGKPVVVLGESEVAAQLVRTMVRDRGQGFRPVAVFSELENGKQTVPEEVPFLGSLENAPIFAHASGINTAILAVRGLRQVHTDELADWASTRFERVIVVPSLAGLTTSAIAVRDLSGVLGVEVKHNLLDPRAHRVKRAIDLLGVVLGGTLILPFLALIAVLIKLDSPGPALFVQERPGLHGRMFRIRKFRTMRTDAEQQFDELVLNDSTAQQHFERYGKLKDDLRVTRVGKWLRKLSLDELPQLWNVFKGEMSLVGPRPYLVNQIPQMSGAEMVVLRILPGISGLWQVSGRNDVAFEQRLEMDTYYVRNWSVWLDLIILFRTILTVLLRRGAS